VKYDVLADRCRHLAYILDGIKIRLRDEREAAQRRARSSVYESNHSIMAVSSFIEATVLRANRHEARALILRSLTNASDAIKMECFLTRGCFAFVA